MLSSSKYSIGKNKARIESYPMELTVESEMVIPLALASQTKM